MKFITKNDIWGIREAIRILWNKSCSSTYQNNGYHSGGDREIEFNAFYNQQIPEAWRETLATVKRHAEDIKAVARDSQIQGLVWFVRNKQFNSGYLNHQLIDEIKKGDVVLPTYIEIQEEQQKWQSHPQYNRERGFSEPIREEMIQIKIHR